MLLVTGYTLLYAAFGWGVWVSAGRNRRLRVAGRMIIAHGVVGLFWPPMHLRGAPFTMTDVMHIVFTIVTLLPHGGPSLKSPYPRPPWRWG